MRKQDIKHKEASNVHFRARFNTRFHTDVSPDAVALLEKEIRNGQRRRDIVSKLCTSRSDTYRVFLSGITVYVVYNKRLNCLVTVRDILVL